MQLTMLVPQTVAASEPLQSGDGAPLSAALICTPEGPAAFPPGERPFADESEPAPKAFATPCKWCRAFGNGVLPPSPAVEALPRREIWQAAVFAEYCDGPVRTTVATGFRSRAPPWIS